MQWVKGFSSFRTVFAFWWGGKKKICKVLGISCLNGTGIERLPGASFWHERSMQCPLPLRESLCSIYGKWNTVEQIQFAECQCILWLSNLIFKYIYTCYNLHLPAFLTLSNKCISRIAQKWAPLSKSTVTDINFSYLLHIHPFTSHSAFFSFFENADGFNTT